MKKNYFWLIFFFYLLHIACVCNKIKEMSTKHLLFVVRYQCSNPSLRLTYKDVDRGGKRGIISCYSVVEDGDEPWKWVSMLLEMPVRSRLCTISNMLGPFLGKPDGYRLFSVDGFAAASPKKTTPEYIAGMRAVTLIKKRMAERPGDVSIEIWSPHANQIVSTPCKGDLMWIPGGSAEPMVVVDENDATKTESEDDSSPFPSPRDELSFAGRMVEEEAGPSSAVVDSALERQLDLIMRTDVAGKRMEMVVKLRPRPGSYLIRPDSTDGEELRGKTPKTPEAIAAFKARSLVEQLQLMALMKPYKWYVTSEHLACGTVAFTLILNDFLDLMGVRAAEYVCRDSPASLRLQCEGLKTVLEMKDAKIAQLEKRVGGLQAVSDQQRGMARDFEAVKRESETFASMIQPHLANLQKYGSDGLRNAVIEADALRKRVVDLERQVAGMKAADNAGDKFAVFNEVHERLTKDAAICDLCASVGRRMFESEREIQFLEKELSKQTALAKLKRETFQSKFAFRSHCELAQMLSEGQCVCQSMTGELQKRLNEVSAGNQRLLHTESVLRRRIEGLERAVAVLMDIGGIKTLTAIENWQAMSNDLKCIECDGVRVQLEESSRTQAALQKKADALERKCADIEAMWKRAQLEIEGFRARAMV